jgi:ABC-2 type transport system permease protein
VLAISSEYTTGLIRTTFASVPRRRAVLAAKAAAVGVITLLAGELIAFATFFTGQWALSAQHLDVTLAHPGALRGVLAAGSYLAVMAWVGLGLGAVIRHTAGAITAMVGVVFLLPQIIHALPSPWDTRIGRFTLDGAAQQMIAQHPHPGYFSASPSFLIVAGYAAVAFAAAALLLTRRDAWPARWKECSMQTTSPVGGEALPRRGPRVTVSRLLYAAPVVIITAYGALWIAANAGGGRAAAHTLWQSLTLTEITVALLLRRRKPVGALAGILAVYLVFDLPWLTLPPMLFMLLTVAAIRDRRAVAVATAAVAAVIAAGPYLHRDAAAANSPACTHTPAR